jgi:hypothetical protein
VNTLLWILQAVFGAMFTLAGALKVFAYPKVLHDYAWVKDVSPGLVTFIGLCEILGGLGLILPGLTRVQPGLTAWAATGLTTIMVLAAGFHLFRGEYSSLPIALVFGALFSFIAYGRFALAPLGVRP